MLKNLKSCCRDYKEFAAIAAVAIVVIGIGSCSCKSLTFLSLEEKVAVLIYRMGLESDTAEQAANALVRIGEPAIPQLMSNLRGGTQDYRCAMVLGAIGESLDELLGLDGIYSLNDRVSQLAILALIEYGRPIPSYGVTRLLVVLTDSDRSQDTRYAAAEALGTGLVPQDQISKVVEALEKEADPSTSTIAFEVALNQRARKSLEALVTKPKATFYNPNKDIGNNPGVGVNRPPDAGGDE